MSVVRAEFIKCHSGAGRLKAIGNWKEKMILSVIVRTETFLLLSVQETRTSVVGIV